MKQEAGAMKFREWCYFLLLTSFFWYHKASFSVAGVSGVLVYQLSAPVGHLSTCALIASESAPVMVTQGFVFRLNTFGNCVTQRPECLQNSGFQTTVISPLVYFSFLSMSSS